MTIYTGIISDCGDYELQFFEKYSQVYFQLPNDQWDSKDFMETRLIPFLNGRFDEELSKDIPSEKKEELRMMFDVAINQGWLGNTAAW